MITLGTAMFPSNSTNTQAWIEDERLYIQTELCETSLEKQLESGHRLEIDGVYAFLRQTLLGLEILHQHKLVHLDIKVCIQPAAPSLLLLYSAKFLENSPCSQGR